MSVDVYDSELPSKPHAEKSLKHPHRSPKEYSEVLAQAKPAKHSWNSYMPLPEHMGFDSQGKEEKILLFLRQHPVVNARWIFIAVLMIVLPLFLAPYLPFYPSLPARYQFMSMVAWYLITAAYVIEHILSWLFNAFIVTDERMIDLDFYSIISKEANYANIDKIQDVSTRSAGLVYSLLDVGTVFAQTAGEVPEFVFDNVSHPTQVVKLLNELSIEEQLEEREGRVR